MKYLLLELGMNFTYRFEISLLLMNNYWIARSICYSINAIDLAIP